jgi:uncharacterized membrane protein
MKQNSQDYIAKISGFLARMHENTVIYMLVLMLVGFIVLSIGMAQNKLNDNEENDQQIEAGYIMLAVGLFSMFASLVNRTMYYL